MSRFEQAAAKLAAALEFAALGCRIAPCSGKNPGAYLGKGWQRQATRDPGLIAGWWEAWPTANVGILGDRAVLPVDVDDPASFDRFEQERGAAPRTPRYLSGGDGGRERLLFRYPGDDALAPVGRMIATGVQLRHAPTSALICVVPPGRNPDTGRELRWTIGLTDAPLADIPPAWLSPPGTGTEHPTGRPTSEWVGVFCRDYTAGCGDTHPNTMRMAAYLVRRLGSAQLAYELLLGWNARRCKPPKPESEIKEQVRWAAQKEAER